MITGRDKRAAGSHITVHCIQCLARPDSCPGHLSRMLPTRWECLLTMWAFYRKRWTLGIYIREWPFDFLSEYISKEACSWFLPKCFAYGGCVLCVVYIITCFSCIALRIGPRSSRISPRPHMGLRANMWGQGLMRKGDRAW